MSGDDRDRLINVNVAIALARRHNTGERAAALAEEEADLTNAWRENPEFSMALNSAVMLDDIRLLKQYLFSDKPLSGGNRRSLAGYIDLLVERIASALARRLDRLDADIAAMQAAMAEASRAVLGGFELNTDVHPVRYPDRYMDARGQKMWDRVCSLVTQAATVGGQEAMSA